VKFSEKCEVSWGRLRKCTLWGK